MYDINECFGSALEYHDRQVRQLKEKEIFETNLTHRQIKALWLHCTGCYG